MVEGYHIGVSTNNLSKVCYKSCRYIVTATVLMKYRVMLFKTEGKTL